jgi:hypothetical protein
MMDEFQEIFWSDLGDFQKYKNYLIQITDSNDIAQQSSKKINAVLKKYNNFLLKEEFKKDWYQIYQEKKNFGIRHSMVNRLLTNANQIQKVINERIQQRIKDKVYRDELKKIDKNSGNYSESLMFNEINLYLKNNWNFNSTESKDFLTKAFKTINKFIDETPSIKKHFGNDIIPTLCKKYSYINNNDEINSYLNQEKCFKEIKKLSNEQLLNEKYDEIMENVYSDLKKDYSNSWFTIKGFKEAEILYKNNENFNDLSNKIKPFISELGLKSDTTFNPNIRLNLERLVYSKVEQGKKPLRELVGWIVEYKLKIAEVKQTHSLKTKLIDLDENRNNCFFRNKLQIYYLFKKFIFQ